MLSRSSRSMAADVCHVYWRFFNTMSSSKNRVTTCVPKAAFWLGPSSPFAAGFRGSPSGKKLLFASVHVRSVCVDTVPAGFIDCGKPPPVAATYRPADALNAVLPFPDRSYAKPSLGDTSQIGRAHV